MLPLAYSKQQASEGGEETRYHVVLLVERVYIVIPGIGECLCNYNARAVNIVSTLMGYHSNKGHGVDGSRTESDSQ